MAKVVGVRMIEAVDWVPMRGLTSTEKEYAPPQAENVELAAEHTFLVELDDDEVVHSTSVFPLPLERSVPGITGNNIKSKMYAIQVLVSKEVEEDAIDRRKAREKLVLPE